MEALNHNITLTEKQMQESVLETIANPEQNKQVEEVVDSILT